MDTMTAIPTALTAEEIRTHREKLGISQAMLARELVNTASALGLESGYWDRAAISRWELNKSLPRGTNMSLLIRTFFRLGAFS